MAEEDEPTREAIELAAIEDVSGYSKELLEDYNLYQHRKTSFDEATTAVARGDDNAPIKYVSWVTGNVQELPARTLLDQPQFSTENMKLMQRRVIAPQEVADLDPLEVAARARAGQLQKNYIQDLKDARTQFDDADIEFDAAGDTLGEAKGLLSTDPVFDPVTGTYKTSELGDAFTGLDSAGNLLTDETGQLQKGFTGLDSAGTLLTDETGQLQKGFTGLDSAGTLLTDETGQLQRGFAGLDAAGNLLTDETGELATAFKGLTSASDLLTAKDGQIEGAFTDLGGARDRYAERIDRPDAYQTEAATALRNAITGAQTATASGIGSLGQLYDETRGIGTTGAEGIRQAYTDAKPSLTSAQAQLAGQSAYGRTESEQAALRARQAAATAQANLQSAGIYGLDQAKAAAEALGGTGAAFDPRTSAPGISAFYSPYEDYAVDKTLADIRRQGDIAQQVARAKAVQAGAFGGSRQGVQLSEMERGVLEQQARTAAQMRDAGYRQAAAQAQESFERQKGRQQNLAQLIGGLGQAGAATYAQAAQQFGGLGLSAEELAQRGALQAAGVGLQEGEALGRMGATYGQLQQAGQEAALRGQLSAQEMAARNAAQIAGLGQSQGDLQMRQGQAMGQLGLGYGQLGQQDIRTMSDLAKTRSDMGFQQSQMMAQQAAQRGQLGLQQSQMMAEQAARRAQLGLDQSQMTAAQAAQRGQLGLSQSQMTAAQAAQRGQLGLDQSQMTAAQAAQRGQLGIQQAQTLGQIGSQQGTLGGQRSLGGLRQASVGELESALGTQELSNLARMGSLGRIHEQSKFAADTANLQAEQNAPFRALGSVVDATARVPSSSSVSQNTGNNNMLSQLLGTGVAIASGVGALNKIM